jgi:peptide deformylase
MILKMRYFDDPILRKHCEPVKEITEEIKKLVADMIETCAHHNGAGLSACQVGVSLRIFILHNYLPLPDGTWALSPPLVFINPKILSTSTETESDTEGCLSIPTLREWVDRPIKLTIEALNLKGEHFVETFEGRTEIEKLNARVRFHENDHLNGVLFIDRLPTKVRKRIDPLLHTIKKNYESSES